MCRQFALAAATLLATILGPWGSTAHERSMLIAVSGGDKTTRLAVIEEVEVRLLSTFPVKTRVVARGYFPDACTRIERVVAEGPVNRIFEITITVVRPRDMACAAMLVQFEETVFLETAGLPSGTYTVRVNGVSRTFEV